MNTSFAGLFQFRLLALMVLTLFFAGKLNSQSDTLHLNYDNIKVVPHDTTLKKLDAWIKSMNGVHQDISVYAYFSKLEFKNLHKSGQMKCFLPLTERQGTWLPLYLLVRKR